VESSLEPPAPQPVAEARPESNHIGCILFQTKPFPTLNNRNKIQKEFIWTKNKILGFVIINSSNILPVPEQHEHTASVIEKMSAESLSAIHSTHCLNEAIL
jgi:hypothetical protein